MPMKKENVSRKDASKLPGPSPDAAQKLMLVDNIHTDENENPGLSWA